MPQSPHRLEAIMNARRVDLGLEWREVAAVAGIRTETLRVVRKGANPPSDLTKRGIETALRWMPGSMDAIADGGEPTPVEKQTEQAVSPAAAEQAEAVARLLATYPPDVQKRALEIFEERRKQPHSTPERDSG